MQKTADKTLSPREDLWRRHRPMVAALLLAALTAMVFAPAIQYDFIRLDDNPYVYENPHVYTGLTWDNARWAFTTVHADYWLPLLWLSYMLDIEIFGQGPAGHHLTNILLHVLSVVLLFWGLHRMTGAPWRSALVAALFAIHPLRVESVVWIAARKDVLSGVFWMLAMLSYWHYTQRPNIRRYWLAPAFMLLGLMSKPSLLTFPFAMLLLDFWPLRRAASPLARGNLRTWGLLLREKIPMFLLAAIFILINLKTHNVLTDGDAHMPLLVRLCLIPGNFLDYLRLILVPTQLAVMYPEHDVIHLPILVLGTLLLVLATWACIKHVRSYPFLLVGWLWFLGNLVPVIRGVRLGLAAYADRFTYLPSIGLFIMLAWATTVKSSVERYKRLLTLTAIGLVAACAMGTRAYMNYWSDTETLFRRTLEVTYNNTIVHAGLASFYSTQGRREEATEQLRAAARSLDYTRRSFALQVRVAESLLEYGKAGEAIPVFQGALIVHPDSLPARHNLATALLRVGRIEEALRELEDLHRRHPDHALAIYLAGQILLGADRPADAVAAFKRTLELRPERIDYISALAVALHKASRSREAIPYLRKALEKEPDAPDLLNNLAWILATTSDDDVRDPRSALSYAEQAAALTEHQSPDILGTLAVAHAANEQFDAALRIIEQAEAVAQQQNRLELIHHHEHLTERFRNREMLIE